jgi:HSP20 family protein
MATQQKLTQQDKSAAPQQTGTVRTEATMRPPVDIFETSDGIRLVADMPGASKEHLHVHVEGNTLIVEGALQFELAGNMQALYADVRSTVYRCSFVLSPELDTNSIEATLKDGVLALRIPKRAELRPRRIEVRS